MLLVAAHFYGIAGPKAVQGCRKAPNRAAGPIRFQNPADGLPKLGKLAC
jgi:hypothetical protein